MNKLTNTKWYQFNVIVVTSKQKYNQCLKINTKFHKQFQWNTIKPINLIKKIKKTKLMHLPLITMYYKLPSKIKKT